MIFVIPGDPVGKGRPRLSTRGGFARAYTPEKTAAWERLAAGIMRKAWGPAESLCAPVAVMVYAIGARPQRLVSRISGGTLPKSSTIGADRLWRPTKPDGDNVLKAALDALVLAGVIVDDVQVVDARVLSLYAAEGEEPSVVVGMEVAGQPPPGVGGAP